MSEFPVWFFLSFEPELDIFVSEIFELVVLFFGRKGIEFKGLLLDEIFSMFADDIDHAAASVVSESDG